MLKAKHLLCYVLAAAMILPLLSLSPALAAGTSTYRGTTYSTDYKTWRQTDPAWANRPLGSNTVGKVGCLVTSVAILMCHSRAYDPAYLNPGSLSDWLNQTGAITSGGGLIYGGISAKASPRFYYQDRVSVNPSQPLTQLCATIRNYQSQGYYLIAHVRNKEHFTAVGNCGTSDAQLFDPGYSREKLLSEYDGTVSSLLLFRANLNGKDTIMPNTPKPPVKPDPPKPPVKPDPPKPPVVPDTPGPSVNPNQPGVPLFYDLQRSYGDGDTITAVWKASPRTTHYNVYIEVQDKGAWVPDYRVYPYADSPFTMDPLPAGTYRMKVQATNKTDWSYADSDYQIFTVLPNHLTVTYNPAGGSVFPESQLIEPNSLYDLPTPKKADGVFIGWYTADGVMVNRKTAVNTSKGHTLTAKWTEEGHSLVKKNNYRSNFEDISPKNWYYNSVAAAYSYGLMNGTSDTTFSPDRYVTAAQTITMAARLHQLIHIGSESFPPTKPWYQTYVDYALANNLLTEVPQDINAPFTRQEVAALMVNAIPASALPTINQIPDGVIPDVHVSNTAIYTLYRAGILSGNDALGTFRPNDPIKRSEVSAILVRMADPNERILFSLP